MYSLLMDGITGNNREEHLSSAVRLGAAWCGLFFLSRTASNLQNPYLFGAIFLYLVVK